MGTCQSTAIALHALRDESSTGKQQVRSSKKFVKTRKRKKLKLDIQKYDTTNPNIFSPSGTRETIPATPSSFLPSPVYGGTTSFGDSVATHHKKQQQPESESKLLVSNPVFKSSNEVEVQIGTKNVNDDTQSSPAVSSGVVEQFQKLKLQAQLTDRSKKRRKLKEKIASRKEMVNEYRDLWKEYEQIQEQVNNKNSGEGIPESISFLKDSDTWFIDFHAIHHQQQTLGNGMDSSSHNAGNLSLLSQTSIEAQKRFFQKKSNERKQKQKRKGSIKRKDVKHQPASSSSLEQASLCKNGPATEQTNGTIGYTGTKDYIVPQRIRSSSTQQSESYLDQTLSHLAPASEPVESVVPSSITLDKNFPRKRNENLSARLIDYTANDNGSYWRRYSEAIRKQAADSSHPVSELSKERFSMICSPKSSLTDESSAVYDTARTPKKYQEVPTGSKARWGNPIWNMSKDQFMMMSSPQPVLQDADKSQNHSSERENVEQTGDISISKASNQLKPTIEYMSKADFLRMSALPDPVPMSALPDHVPTVVGDPTFDDSQVMSKISCEDTFTSPSGNQERLEEADESPEVSTSIEDEEEDCYAWDGHMDDEEFWDMDIRRQSLGDIDELASQVSSRISTLLTKFREDNNSIKTRSVNL